MVTCFRAVSTFLPLRPVSNILRSAAAIFAVQSCTCLAACSGGDYEPLERSPRRRSPVRRIGAPRVVNALPDRINWKPCCAGRRRRKRGKEEALRIRFRLFHLAVTGLQSGDLCAFAKLWKRPTRARSEKVGAVVAGRDDASAGFGIFYICIYASLMPVDAGPKRTARKPTVHSVFHKTMMVMMMIDEGTSSAPKEKEKLPMVGIEPRSLAL